MSDATDIVLAYNVREDESIIPSSENVAFFNRTFNFSDYLTDLNILDMMVISTKGCHSDKEDGYLEFYTRDLSFKIVDDVKHILKNSKKKYGRKKELEGKEKGIEKGKLEVAKKLLKLNFGIEDIVKATGFSREEIEKLKL